MTISLDRGSTLPTSDLEVTKYYCTSYEVNTTKVVSFCPLDVLPRGRPN